MGILSGLFRTRDGPRNATSGSTYSFFMGSSAAGKSVNERSAMQMTAVYACVRILSESIAGLPLHMYRYEDGSGNSPVTGEPFGVHIDYYFEEEPLGNAGALFKIKDKLASRISNLYVFGRLGDFQYYNMDQALEVALKKANIIIDKSNRENK